jgi:hypothetical protein
VKLYLRLSLGCAALAAGVVAVAVIVELLRATA